MKVESVNRFRLNHGIRIGLVGCGRVAEFGHLPALRRVATMKLTGVVDVNKTRCQDIAPGVPAHENLCALIEAGGLDALIISTPTRFHLAQARCAAEAGLPALLEKPPGLNLEEAHAVQALNPSPWIAFNRRFEPGIAKLKGNMPRNSEVHLLLELHYRRSTWNPFDMQDDALLDLGPHLVDLTRWLTGDDILSARALSLSERRAKFELRLTRGHATIACSNNAPYWERIEVKDARGSVSGSFRRGGLVSGIAARLQPNRENPLVRPMVGQLEAFGRAVCGRSADLSLATAADGLAVMSVIDAVRRSAIQGGVECSLQLQQ